MPISPLAPHPFTLRQLQYAIAVADALSFRKAAERCHVSQPSLSTQIGELEDALGVRLFERDRRRVLVTAAGAALLEAARGVLLAADDLVAAGRTAGDPLAGTLRIGVIPTVSPYLLPAATPALRAAFPKLDVRWLEDKTEVLVARLHAGALDAALLALEAELGDVEHAVVAKDPFLLAAPKGHPLAARAGPAAPSELREADVLLLDDGHCLREQALAVCARARASELEFRATSLPTLVSMVAGGAGVTLLPALAAPVEARRGDLVLRAFAEPAPHRTIALVWRAKSPVGPALGKIAGALRECVGPSSKGRPPSYRSSRT